MQFPVELPQRYLELAQTFGVNPDDIAEQHTRGGGPGGQKINKTTNCVHLLHEPTGVMVRVQRYRELSTNRLSAYKQLIMKIDEHVRGKESLKAQKIYKLRKQKMRRTRKNKEKMLEEKHRRSVIKEGRKDVL